MKTRHYSIPLYILSILFVFSCKDIKKENTSNPEEMLSISHALDTIEIKKEPKKIVALDYAALENLDELGIPVIGMAKSHVPTYLEKYKNDAKVTDLGTIFEVDYEKLSELNPDVIFISARMLKNYKELSKIAPTVYTASEQGKELESFKKNLQLFGTIFNKQDSVQNIISRVDNSINALRTKAEASGKNALIVMYNNGKFSAFGKSSRFGIIYNLFGFKEAYKDLEAARHGQAISNEFIQKVNPDYIFMIDRSAVVNKSATNKETIENILIQQTNAFKNGNIIYLSPDAWYLSGDGVTSFEIMINEVANSFN